MPLLKRATQQLTLSHWDWLYLLRLAKTHGWDSHGLAAPQIQSLTANDALALAAALEAALPKIPAQEGPEEDLVGLSGMPEDPLEWFRAEGKVTVMEFVAFCRGGAFVVE